MEALLATGLRMGYEDVGSGPPVVLLHAFPLSRAMWRPQLEGLGAGRRLIAPDFRGFGGTDGFDGNPSVEQLAEDVNALLIHLEVREQVCLVGLSMGGYVALAFARYHPPWLRALVLADTRAEPDTPEGKANRDQMIDFARKHTAREVIDQLLPKLVSPETLAQRPAVLEEVRAIASAQSTAAITDALRALRDRPDARPLLNEITVPTLVVVGEEDALTPPAVARALAAGIRGARVETIPGAGHLSSLEQPARFNAAVGSFLQMLS